MLNAIWTRIFGLGRGIYHAVPWTRFISGLGAGGILLALFQQFLSQLGTSPPRRLCTVVCRRPGLGNCLESLADGSSHDGTEHEQFWNKQ